MHAVNQETEEVLALSHHYSLNINDYSDCHPYIYWWIRTVLRPLCRKTVNVSDFRLYQAFKSHGFEHELVAESLHNFIRTHGQIIQSWFLQTSPTPAPPMTEADLAYAIKSSRKENLIIPTEKR